MKIGLRAWIAIAAGWTALALFFAVSASLTYKSTGRPANWTLSIERSLVEWWLWAVLTPLIVWLARRYPLDTRWPVRNAAIHLFAGFFIAAAKTIADRAVTQRKLHWLANFFCVASGVDDYVGTVNPTAGFSYGDGATTSFFLPVLFTNANTTAVTLNINGLGQKNVLKMVGTALAPIDAGDIAAGSIHLLAYDGTQFQLLSVIPRTDINTPPHGIPHFIAPVLIVNQPSGSAVAWQTYNTLAADGIPATASAIILQVDWCATDTGAGPAEIQVRRSSADSAYVAASLCPLAVADVQGMSSQGIYPFKNTVGVLSFDYQSTTNFNGEYNIRLIGYIS